MHTYACINKQSKCNEKTVDIADLFLGKNSTNHTIVSKILQ